VLLDSEGFMALGPALLMLTPPTIFALFLGVGLKRYLQLPRAWLLAIVTVIVSFLFIFTGLTVFVVLSQGGWG
jgi:4-amino-4-deoxy-L-arabinose transferase-like glycosyltransferase